MKKLNLILLFVVCVLTLNAQIGTIKVTNGSAIQIRYQNYRWLGFGFQSSTTSNSQWAIEHRNNGLNFWKP